MADQEMVTLTIEGVEVSVPKGTSIIEAAKQAGILIPHYCYHPGLPVAGVCRMCLVEVENTPKLQIACATQVAEGQVVNVFSDEALDARKGVLEFLLINHPLDCPICDQAGECELQDYVFQEGQARTRYSEFPKRYNPVENFGDDVLYVPNRCILCTRCVRFMEDIADEAVLNVSERGDRAFIGIHPDQQLDHPWAGNVVDLCPVGSLISKDFLHKARAWELDKAPSICTGCSQGCNVNIDTRDDVVVRLRPRANLDVNRYFMCDYGRSEYRWLNRGDRIEAPLVMEGGELVAADWDHALARAAQIIKGSTGPRLALVSPGASNEALYLLKALLEGAGFKGAYRVERTGPEFPLPGVSDLALRGERAPNVAGLDFLGYTGEFDSVVREVEDAALTVVLDDNLEGCGTLSTGGNLIYAGTLLPAVARNASVVFPMANVAEEDGTFTNRDGRVQRYYQAKSSPGMARPAWWVFGELLHEVTGGDPIMTAEEAFSMMAGAVPEYTGLSYRELGLRGVVAGSGRTSGVPA